MNEAEIDYVQNQAGDRIEEVLDALDMYYEDSNNYLHACCPVHGGDNPRGWYWIRNTMSWRCHTRGCESIECTGKSSSVFGLVRGVHYEKTGNQMRFMESVNFVARVLGINTKEAAKNSWAEKQINETIKRHRKRSRNRRKDTGQLCRAFFPC